MGAIPRMDRKTDLVNERLDHLLRAIGRQHARHVLDADRVRAELLELLRVLDEAVERVHRTDRVGDGALEVAPALLDGVRGGLDVADVVERIEDTEDVDPVALRGMHEARDDLIAVVAVADQVLSAQQHLQRRLRAVALDGAEPLPRVLVEEAQRGIERGTAPDLERPVAHAVHGGKDRQHVADRHARRPQRLVSVAQRRVCYADRSHDSPDRRRFWRPRYMSAPGD
jgi:hypothetical protein